MTPTATPETPTATPETPTPTPVCDGSAQGPDSYEPDNNYTQAQVISTDGVRQCHVNTNPASEEDWVKFQTVNGHEYEVRTQLINDINQSDAAANDTLLYLYDTNGSTQLAFNDDVGYTTWYMGSYYYRESLIRWTAPSNNWYYVRELQWGPTAGYTIRDFHWYWLWIQDLSMPTPAPLGMVATLATATATPETPTATAETPTDTLETPTATPVTPTAIPDTPTAAPDTPTAAPETPTAAPETPTAAPEAPTATPEAPTATPVTPTAIPDTPAVTSTP